jgi:hypothetical protein
MSHEWYDNTTPPDSDDASEGASEIRELKTGVNATFTREHYFAHPVTPAPATPGDGIHTVKASRIYPVTNRTVVAAADKYPGLLIWETGTATFTYWTGSAWAVMPVGSGGVYTVEVVDDQMAEVNHGYITNKLGSRLELTLPDVSAVGNVVLVYGKGGSGWKIKQGAGQQIRFGTASTASGVGGYIRSINTYDCVFLICVVADAEWEVYSSTGNLFIV